MPKAYIFSGLPGAGKTTLAKLLAKTIPNTIYFRIDTVEYYLKKAYPQKLTEQGYEIVYYQAKENLELGKNVIVDCCNPILESRKLWHKLFTINFTKLINIEITCSDKKIHKDRVESRFKTNSNKYPTWQNVLDRDYEVWSQDIIKIDTSSNSIELSFKALISKLEELK